MGLEVVEGVIIMNLKRISVEALVENKSYLVKVKGFGWRVVHYSTGAFYGILMGAVRADNSGITAIYGPLRGKGE